MNPATTQSSACMRLQQPLTPLRLEQRALPAVSASQVLLKVRACAVCRTDLHIVDGELTDATLPIVPGHEIVGEVMARGADTSLEVGVRVGGGIHMSDIPTFPYALLWGERVLRSVANLTRPDAIEFLALAGRIPLQIRTRSYTLSQANDALDDLRSGRLEGAAVLLP